MNRRDPSERHGPRGAFDAQGKAREARLAFIGLTLMGVSGLCAIVE